MKWLFILLFGLSSIFLVSATCQPNNDFEIGEDFNICTGKCKFYNSTGDYQACNSTISCYLVMQYPNSSMFGSSLDQMQFNASGNDVFNYSYGNLTDTTSFPAGIYNAQINCYSLFGFSGSINFETSVSSEEETFISKRTSNPLSVPSIVKEAKDFVLKDLLKDKWKFAVGIVAIVFIIVMIYDYKRHNWKKLGDYLANKIKRGHGK